jgi:hypothetical protein
LKLFIADLDLVILFLGWPNYLTLSELTVALTQVGDKMWLYVMILLTMHASPAQITPQAQMGLPLLGYLPIVTEDGDVIRVNIGPGPRVVVHSGLIIGVKRT